MIIKSPLKHLPLPGTHYPISCHFLKHFSKCSFKSVFNCMAVAASVCWTDSQCLPLMVILTVGKSQESHGANSSDYNEEGHTAMFLRANLFHWMTLGSSVHCTLDHTLERCSGRRTFQNGFREWQEQWDKCVGREEGDYFEGNYWQCLFTVINFFFKHSPYNHLLQSLLTNQLQCK